MRKDEVSLKFLFAKICNHKTFQALIQVFTVYNYKLENVKFRLFSYIDTGLYNSTTMVNGDGIPASCDSDACV